MATQTVALTTAPFSLPALPYEGNHSLFWVLVAPATGSHATTPHAQDVEHAPNAGSDAARALDAAVHENFSNMVTLRETFAAAAAGRFGSGGHGLCPVGASSRSRRCRTRTPRSWRA